MVLCVKQVGSGSVTLVKREKEKKKGRTVCAASAFTRHPRRGEG